MFTLQLFMLNSENFLFYKFFYYHQIDLIYSFRFDKLYVINMYYYLQ